MNVVITGTSKGIGLELTKVFLQKGCHVFAIARNLKQASELNELQSKAKGYLQLIEADLNDKAAFEIIASALQPVDKIDLLINNAGIYRGDETLEDFSESFLINATAPYFLIKKLIPKLKAASAPKVICLSSMMGSIADNSSGGAHSYRASKSALNMLIKGLSVEEPDVAFAITHPGWVQTQMGGPNAQITVQESVSGLYKVIERLNLQDSGIYVDYQGRNLPW